MKVGNKMGCQRKTNIVMFKEDYVILFIKQKRKVYRVYLDLEDYDKIKNYSWCHDGYAYAIARKNNKAIRMHKLILTENKFIDHMNNNGLDNRKNNLKYTDCIKNAQNHKNISRIGKSRGKWRARITLNKKDICLGYFDTAKEAWKVRYREERIQFNNKRQGGFNENTIHRGFRNRSIF